MFKKDLETKLKAIFGTPKVSFDEPGDSFEQDCIFVEILETQCNTGSGSQSAKVSGAIVMYSERGKLPYGYFNKRLEQAKAEDKSAFFFFNMDMEPQNSPARLVNISERRASFVFLYSAQYDPNQGELTSVEF